MTWRRHGAVLLAASFLIAQLVGLVHQSTEQHTVCPEHGELIHGRTVAAAWAGPVVEARGAPQAPRDDHDVCELAVASHERIAPPDPPHATDTPPEDGREAAPPPVRRSGPSVALYRTAPKTSPPA
jgi:hypothetical protein